MKTRTFGIMPNGEPVTAYTLEGTNGASLTAITLGGIVTSLFIPDRTGYLADVVLGFERLEPYLTRHPYFGAITGRVAGRIPGARFTIGEKSFRLVNNDGPNHLHGGLRGLDTRIWKASVAMREDSADSVQLSYRSPDGEEGYPGTLDLSVTYTLTKENHFLIETAVTTDSPTPVALTHHSYFNLSGEGGGSIHDHLLTVYSDQAFAVDQNMTPLGRLESVSGRAADLTSPRRLRDVIPKLFRQHGDLYFIAQADGTTLLPVAQLHEVRSGRVLTVSTTESCLQMYTGISLDGTFQGKSRKAYASCAGICLECQGYPGAMETPGFGSILAHPGPPLRRMTRYAFSTT